MDADSMRVVDLRHELAKRGLSTKGRKPVLVARLKEDTVKEKSAGSGREGTTGKVGSSGGDSDEDQEEEDQEEEEERKEEEEEEETPTKQPSKTWWRGSSPSSSTGSLKIITWNVAGFRACAKKGFYKYMEAEDPDIVCLSEVKCTKGEVPKVPAGYRAYWAECKSAKGKHGVGVFSKIKAKSSQIDGISDVDGRAITLEFEGFYLVNTYVPNAGERLKFMDKRMKWDAELREHINELQKSKPVIWTGDLNCAYHDYDVYDGETNKKRKKSAGFSDEERSNFGEIIKDDGFVDVYRTFHPNTREEAMTFWSMRAGMRAKKKGWRLDYFMVTPILMDFITSCENDQSQLGSDHVPLILTLQDPAHVQEGGGSSEGSAAGSAVAARPSSSSGSSGSSSSSSSSKSKKPKKRKIEEKESDCEGETEEQPKEKPKRKRKKKKVEMEEEDEDVEMEPSEGAEGDEDVEMEPSEGDGWDDLTKGIHPSWEAVLSDEFKQPYFQTLQTHLSDCAAQGEEIFPPRNMIYSAFTYTPWDKVKVVILGQDPYHDNGQAHGLCFSVQKGVKLPGSLRNIYKELAADIGCAPASHGYLEKWARQGVLMINTVLTVKAHKANSHKKFGWMKFTDAVIKHLGQDRDNLVFILWGKQAQAKAKKLVDGSKHLVLNHTHPSPLSAFNGFHGSKPFSQTNDYLKNHGKGEIDWQIEG